MGTGKRRTPADFEAEILKALPGGNTRVALAVAVDAIKLGLTGIRDSDPARAELLEASQAGSLLAIAEALPTMQPRRPPGYTGGRPDADHLLAAYTAARHATSRPAERGR